MQLATTVLTVENCPCSADLGTAEHSPQRQNKDKVSQAKVQNRGITLENKMPSG